MQSTRCKMSMWHLCQFSNQCQEVVNKSYIYDHIYIFWNIDSKALDHVRIEGLVTSLMIKILNFFNHKIHFCLKYLKSKLTPWTLNHLFWAMASSYSYFHALYCYVANCCDVVNFVFTVNSKFICNMAVLCSQFSWIQWKSQYLGLIDLWLVISLIQLLLLDIAHQRK